VKVIVEKDNENGNNWEKMEDVEENSFQIV